jgi:hypothetical protein
MVKIFVKVYPGELISMNYSNSVLFLRLSRVVIDHCATGQCCQLFLKVSGQIFEKIRPLGKKNSAPHENFFGKNK